MIKHLFLFSLLALIGGCQKTKSPLQKPKRTQELRVAFSTNVVDIEPHKSLDTHSVTIQKLLFEGLMHLDESGTPVLAVADRVSVSDDRLTYTFHLKDTYWTDGSPVTAEDFLYSWRRAIDPITGSRATHTFYCIKNARDANTGKKSLDEVGIHVLDEKTLLVELEHPTPYFLELTAYPTYLPVNRHVVENDPNWTRTPESLVCNGPFRMKEWKISDRLELVKNPMYWDAENIHLEVIHCPIIKEAISQLYLFEKGELDWIGRPFGYVPLDAVDDLRKKGILRTASHIGAMWIVVNMQKFPLNNKKLRRALAVSVNRKEIVDKLLPFENVPATRYIPPPLHFQKEGYVDDGNEALAKQLFSEAIEEMGITKEAFPPISVTIAMEEHYRRIAQYLQDEWKRLFGIQLKIEGCEFGVVLDRLGKGEFDLGFCQWISWLRDPIYFFEVFKYPSDRYNFPRWSNTEYVRLLDLSDQEVSLEKRRSYLHQAEQLFMEDLPVIPVFFTNNVYLKHPKLKGIHILDTGVVDMRFARFED